MQCRICGSKENAIHIKVREMMIPTREEFGYFECANCHCLQIEKIPDNLGEYYGEDYYSFQDTEAVETFAAPDNFEPILDVGCGAGKFLKNLRRSGCGNLTGCDPFLKEDIKYGEDIHIYKKTIHEMTGEYAQIFLNDSFEHVTDPHEVMESICRLLKPDGIARINIPVYPNIAFEMFGSDWYQLDAPRHIFLHSVESMHYLADKHGMEIVKIEYNADPSQIYRSFLYTQDIPFWEQTMEKVIQLIGEDEVNEIRRASDEANESGYGDHAAFYLIKRK